MRDRWISASLFVVLTLVASPAFSRPDDKHGRGHEKREEREDRRFWKEHDRNERHYWKEREKAEREHERHRFHESEDRDHRDWDHANPRHRHPAPPWMTGYWRPGETRRYVALVPGDPSRIYVFLDGRWMLRQIRDPRARLDLQGAYDLPMAPPPVAPPRIGVDLRIVFFN
jgi:hypothetical protein